MKKILLGTILSLSTIYASNIQLTGEYSEQLGNPFRKLLNENKKGNISIYSEDKQVVLKVESNLDSSDIYSQLRHKKSYVLDNKSVENVIEDYFIEEFNVTRSKKNNAEVNVLSGKVFLTYTNHDNHISHLTNVEVDLKVEVIKNGNKFIKTIKMDNKLGRAGDNYDYSLSVNDFKNISVETLDRTIKKIIETELYILIKG